jgi:hypothetical protein
MGKVEDFKRIFAKQEIFDGSICKKCIYSNYNNVLKVFKEKNLEHSEFV